MRNANGYGSVYKLQGNRRRPYTAVVVTGLRPDGKYNRQTLGYYATREEGMAALAEYHANPYDVAEKSAPLEEIYRGYINYCAGRGKPVVVPIQSAWKHLAPLYDVPLSEIKVIDIQRIIDSLRDKPTTAGRARSIFTRLYKYSMITGLNLPDIAKAVELPKKPKSKMHRPFTADEITALWEGVEGFCERIALIYIHTGLRPQELFQIRAADVHLDERYMVGGMKTEAGKNRRIPIAKKILPLINGFLSNRGEYLMARGDGSHINYHAARRRWESCKAPVIIDHLMHDGRHTCISLLDSAGVRRRTIQLIVGHAGRDVEEDVYTHKTLEELLAAVDMI